jgi:hypothetical protein
LIICSWRSHKRRRQSFIFVELNLPTVITSFPLLIRFRVEEFRVEEFRV